MAEERGRASRLVQGAGGAPTKAAMARYRKSATGGSAGVSSYETMDTTPVAGSSAVRAARGKGRSTLSAGISTDGVTFSSNSSSGAARGSVCEGSSVPEGIASGCAERGGSSVTRVASETDSATGAAGRISSAGRRFKDLRNDEKYFSRDSRHQKSSPDKPRKGFSSVSQ